MCCQKWHQNGSLSYSLIKIYECTVQSSHEFCLFLLWICVSSAPCLEKLPGKCASKWNTDQWNKQALGVLDCFASRCSPCRAAEDAGQRADEAAFVKSASPHDGREYCALTNINIEKQGRKNISSSCDDRDAVIFSILAYELHEGLNKAFKRSCYPQGRRLFILERRKTTPTTKKIRLFMTALFFKVLMPSSKMAPTKEKLLYVYLYS